LRVKERAGGDGRWGWVGRWDHGRRETFPERRVEAAVAVGTNWGGAEHIRYSYVLRMYMYPELILLDMERNAQVQHNQ